MEANGEVTDLVAKRVCLGCVRAKGCGLWKLYTTTGCNQTKDITIPIYSRGLEKCNFNCIVSYREI